MIWNFIYVFGVGLFVSFMGTLPLGTLNVAAMQIATSENVKAGVKFSLGVVCVEIIYLRLSLNGVGWLVQHPILYYWLQWLTVALLVALTVFTFRAAFHTHKNKNVLFNNKMNKFVLGAVMSAINPATLPFWFGWTSYLMTNRVLLPKASEFNIFTLGAGIGTVLGLGIFVYGGNYVVKRLNANQKKLDIFIGCIFAITALIQAYKVMYPHGLLK
jgi:threonine/homoserine/homoserine lactone efflux protein